VGESALRALSKLGQVMPARLRKQVAAVHDATVTLTPNATDPVDPEILRTLARACRDHEHVGAGYTDLHGNVMQRRVEPYPLVTTRPTLVPAGLRPRPRGLAQPAADRMSEVIARDTTFIAREAPDAATYISRSISSSPYRYVATVRYDASAELWHNIFRRHRRRSNLEHRIPAW
jgi:predicted DNA-binding transcriptional regulator YafY